MPLKDGRDYLLLIWKDPKTKKRFTIGELSKNGQFEFSYGYEYHKALSVGFEPLIAFPDSEKIYRHDELFPVFASRLPDPRRKGIDEILKNMVCKSMMRMNSSNEVVQSYRLIIWSSLTRFLTMKNVEWIVNT